MTDLEWIRERETNAQRIAETKVGADRDSWIDDASRLAHVRRKLALFDEMFFRLQVTTREWQSVFGSEQENSTPGDVLEKNKALIIKVRKLEGKRTVYPDRECRHGYAFSLCPYCGDTEEAN